MRTYRQDAVLSEVIKGERAHAQAVLCEIDAMLQPTPPTWLTRLFGATYRWSGGHYSDEIAAWARALKRDVNALTACQCSYELAQLGALAQGVGCTTGVTVDPVHGPTLVRSLDWGLSSMKSAAYIRKRVDFISVDIAGFVGILTGMRPGAFALAINYAPPAEVPRFRWGPAFLARHVLETCVNYAEALEVLRTTELSSPVFFTLCGTEPSEACVIERTRREACVRRTRLVQANHHVAKWVARNNRLDPDVLLDSQQRSSAMTTKIKSPRRAFQDPLINNDITVYCVSMSPRSGRLQTF